MLPCVLQPGLSLREKGEYDKAIADFTEAIRLDPKYAKAFFGRASAYERNGEITKADEDFAQAKKLGYKEQRSEPTGENALQP